jgi:hypothetical protein
MVLDDDEYGVRVAAARRKLQMDSGKARSDNGREPRSASRPSHDRLGRPTETGGRVP